MKFKTGDKVVAIAGKDKGNTGRISKVLKKSNKVIVEGLNLVKKHIKPNANNQTGAIVSIEAPIHASNVMFIDEKTNKRSRKRVVADTKETKKTVKKEVKKEKEAKEVKKEKEVKKAAPKKAKAKED